MTPQEAADHIELNALVVDYALAADTRDFEGYTALFVPSATITGYVFGVSEPFVHVEGRDAIAGVLHANDAFVQTFHAVENHRYHINGETATGITYCVARHYREQGIHADVVTAPLRYHDDYVRTSEGWRFAAREIHFTWSRRPQPTPPSWRTGPD